MMEKFVIIVRHKDTKHKNYIRDIKVDDVLNVYCDLAIERLHALEFESEEQARAFLPLVKLDFKVINGYSFRVVRV